MRLLAPHPANFWFVVGVTLGRLGIAFNTMLFYRAACYCYERQLRAKGYSKATARHKAQGLV